MNKPANKKNGFAAAEPFFLIIQRESTVIVDSGRANVLKYKILDSMTQERWNYV